MRKFGLGLAFALLAVGGCSEPSGSGNAVNIPSVNFTCSSSNCLVNASRTAYVYITSSGCTTFANIDFGIQASGSVSVSCTGAGGCSGTTSSWNDRSGTAITAITSGTYDICVYIDMNADWGSQGGAPNIGDAKASTTTVFSSGMAVQVISGFANIVTPP